MKEKRSPVRFIREELFLLVKLNILFLITAIPVITIPAALTSMMKILTERLRGRETDVIPDYFLYLRVSFFTSLRAGILIAVSFTLFGYVLWFYQTAESASALMLGALRGTASVQVVIVYLTGCYLNVVEAVADLPFLTAVGKSFQLMIVYLRQTLLCLLAGVILFGGFFLLFPYSLPFAGVIGVSLWCAIVAFYVFPVVEMHIPLN